MWAVCCLCLLLWGAVSEGRVVLEKGAFLYLPDAANKYAFNAETATRAAYDDQENFLYVIGHKAHVLHVVNLTDPQNPELLSTKAFSSEVGLPNFVKVCRNALSGEGFLAVSFETSRLYAVMSKGHVHFYRLLTAASVQGSLTLAKDIVTTDSYDPRPIDWTSDCSMLLVASEGDPHQYWDGGVFIDPPADIELLLPSFGSTVIRRSIPVSAKDLEGVEVRHVFHGCDDDTAPGGQLVQDLEPTAVHIDKNDMAYIVFQDNNAIATLDLRYSSTLQYYSLGTKDWSNYAFDGSYEDKAIKLQSRKIRSFYQPRDLASFELDGKIYLATADTGSIRKVHLDSCRFDESIIAFSWRPQFADGLTADEISQLRREMSDTNEIGRLLISKLKTPTDGWDTFFEGYDFVTTFGGRGFSILDPADNMKRVYDSGDHFERYFTTENATQSQKAMFNALAGYGNVVQSSRFDRGSPDRGPLPTAIAVGDLDDSTKVVVIANGRAGGLYTYSVRSGPVVNFESYIRRGEAGMTWEDSFEQRDTDSVGEPTITDLLFIDDQGQKTVVAVSQGAGALSFYTLRNQ